MDDILKIIGWILVGIGAIRYYRDETYSEHVSTDATTWTLAILGALALIISAII